MEKHNFTHFNPHCYEEHLSPFGRKVLKILINKWKTDRESKIENVMSQQVEYNHPRKVLTFSNNESTRTPLSPLMFNQVDATRPVNASLTQPPVLPIASLEKERSIHSGKSENDVIEDTLFDIPHERDCCGGGGGGGGGGTASAPTSAEFVKTVQRQQQKLPNISSDYLAQTVLTNKNGRKIDFVDTINDFYIFRPNLATNNYDDGVIRVNFHNETTGKEDARLFKTSNVDWDDMFDTDLFSDKDSTKTSKDIQEKSLVKDNTLEILFHKDNPKKISKLKIAESNEKKRKSGPIETKTVKRKNLSNVTDSITKKMKKSEIESSKLRKEKTFKKHKCTMRTAVNDWLYDVDPKNTVEEDDKDSTKMMDLSPIQKIQEFNTSCKHLVSESRQEIDIEMISNEKSKKKVVQAQLANKGGVMKFAKPKKVKSKSDESAVINGTKDKKRESKFVAPIKSQIPVKDISYDIITVTEENIEDHRRNITSKEKDVILMILVYSNGFCQLNLQHTDDTCVAEGIMASFDDRFYYFKLDSFKHDIKDLIPHLLNNNSIMTYEGKSLLLTLLSESIDVSSVEIIDAKIGGALLEPDSPPENFSELQKLVKFTPQFTITTACALQKAAWYITLLKECNTSVKALLVENSLWKVFFDIEMKLLPIIAGMEQRGVLVDLDKLKSMETIIMAKMKEMEQACHRAAGKPFQVTSAPQVRAILYDELQLDAKRNVKIRETITKGAKSTSEAMLKSLMTVHPLPKLILEYRHLHKAHATFLTGIAQHAHKTNVVKPTWDQTAAATGRIASNNPNLQAIPKAPFSLIMFPGPEDEDVQQLSFRSVYVARAGHTLLGADFQHVECRVFAHAAADAALLGALRSGQDLFRVLAAQWLGKPEGAVGSADRERTKRIVYASLYGAGARRLMDILDVSYEQALAISASFNRTFPSLKAFGRSVVAQCARAGGRLATLGGRARLFPDITSADFARKSHAERQAVNFVVQGSAADLCKLAMVATEAALRGARPPLAARLLLQIHDELVWEVRDEDLHRVAGAVRAAMESCGARCGLALALPVALSVGRSWGDMHNYTAC